MFVLFCICRKDSFITHRAFCNVLAQESTNFTSSIGTINNNNNLHPIPFPLKIEENQHPCFPSFQQNPNPTSIGFGLAGPNLGPGSSPMLGSSCPAWELNSPVETPPLPLPLPPHSFFHNMMTLEDTSFEEALNGILMNNRANYKDVDGGGDDGEITRDFLGLRAVARQPNRRMFENEVVINDTLSNNLDYSSFSTSTFGMHQNNHQTHQTTFWRD